MSLREQPTADDPPRECAPCGAAAGRYADVDVMVEEDPDNDELVFRFETVGSGDVEVATSGDVVPGTAEVDGEGLCLSFTLAAGPGEVRGFKGIQLWASDDRVTVHPTVTDTHGEYYPGTGFEVSSLGGEGRVTTLILRRVMGADHLDEPEFYTYRLTVIDGAGNTHLVDPRIYNDGGG